MTITSAKIQPSARKLARTWSSDELMNLWELAQELQGSPLPGVRLDEEDFQAEYGDEDIRAEWVDGEVVVMAPASGEHNDIAGWLYRLAWEFVDYHDLGIVRGPEFTIRLTSVRRWRVPDVLFISKSKFAKVHPTYLEGGPDLVVEVISPDSEACDWRDKYHDYEASGVREYWIVDPLGKRVDCHVLNRAKQYSQVRPDEGGRIHSRVLKGLYIRPEWLWRASLPKLTGVLKELKLR